MEVGFAVAVLDHGVPRLGLEDLDTVGTFDGRFFDQDRFSHNRRTCTEPFTRRANRAVNELAAERLGFHVGQRLDLGTYAFDQISSPSFVAEPPTPKLLTHTTVVGIGRFPDEVLQDEADRSLRMLLTPAYKTRRRVRSRPTASRDSCSTRMPTSTQSVPAFRPPRQWLHRIPRHLRSERSTRTSSATARTGARSFRCDRRRCKRRSDGASTCTKHPRWQR